MTEAAAGGEEPLEDEGRRAERDCVVPELAGFDRDARGRVVECLLCDHRADPVDEQRPEPQPDPAADDDQLQVEQVDEVRRSGAEHRRSPIEYLRGSAAVAGGVGEAIDPLRLVEAAPAS